MNSNTRVSTYDLSPLLFDKPYEFPRHLLPTVMKGLYQISSYPFSNPLPPQYIDDSKIPLVLVACGSFSPITYLHLRMFGKFVPMTLHKAN